MKKKWKTLVRKLEKQVPSIACKYFRDFKIKLLKK